MSYEKPKPRPGLVCYFCEWDRSGKLVRALYRKAERPAPDISAPDPREIGRGIKAGGQGSLL